MSTPSHGSPPPLTVSQVEDWIATATTKHGKVRVVSTTLREESQTLHSKAAALRERSAQLIKPSAPLQTSLRTLDMQKAEAPVLPMFKDEGQRQEGDNTSQDGPPKEGVV